MILSPLIRRVHGKTEFHALVDEVAVGGTDAHDLMAIDGKFPTEMLAKEPGGACYENVHAESVDC